MFGERTLAALTALLLLSAGVAPAVGATVAGADGPVVADHDDEYDDDEYDDDYNESADRAYVDGDDVVLVYEYDDEESDDGKTGHVATNVSEGLAYLTTTDEDAPSNATGDATVIVEPDRLDANGTASVPAPEDLQSLDVTMEQTVDDTTSESAFELSAAVTGEDADSSFEAMETAGFVESSGETLASNGSVTVETDEATEPQRYHVVVTERDDSYRIDFEESYAPEDPDDWAEREDAAENLRERFCGGMGGSGIVSCAVDLREYEFDGDRVTLGYTVTYDGLKSTLESMGPMMLSSADNVSMEEASRTVDRVTNLTIDRVETTVEVEDGTTDVTWNATMSGVDDLALAYADVLEITARMQQNAPASTGMATGMSGPFGASPEETAEDLRTQIEAQRAADLTGTVTWDAAVEATEDGGTYDISLASSADNWGDYVDELEARDGPVPATTDLEVEAGIEGDRVVADGAMRVEKDDLFAEQFASTDRMTERMDDEEAERFAEMVSAVEDADFQRARADVSADGETVSMEAAAAVGNASALTAPLDRNLSATESTYTDLDEGTTYVRLDGVADGDATESDVRDLALVGENTTVAFEDPEEPAMDVPYVRGYLGLDGDGSGAFPTMMVAGGVAAATAAAGGGLLLFNRMG